jgi:hypothetical protein
MAQFAQPTCLPRHTHDWGHAHPGLCPLLLHHDPPNQTPKRAPTSATPTSNKSTAWVYPSGSVALQADVSITACVWSPTSGSSMYRSCSESSSCSSLHGSGALPFCSSSAVSGWQKERRRRRGPAPPGAAAPATTPAAAPRLEALRTAIEPSSRDRAASSRRKVAPGAIGRYRWILVPITQKTSNYLNMGGTASGRPELRVLKRRERTGGLRAGIREHKVLLPHVFKPTSTSCTVPPLLHAPNGGHAPACTHAPAHWSIPSCCCCLWSSYRYVARTK